MLEPGSNLNALYSYDVGNRLTRVDVTGGSTTQTRTFDYDNRGFLESETHPEKSGTVVYDDYDARGNPGEKEDNGVVLKFLYDDAERLELVELPGGQDLKEFQYGTSGNARGRLTLAQRLNVVPGLPAGFEFTSPVLVEEDYAYGNDGRVSQRTTTVGGVHSFSLGFQYDDLGNVEQIDYPVNPNRSVAYGYDEGLLTSVTAGPGLDGDISYHPNGLWHRVEHGNQVTDVQTNDPFGMRRPRQIQTQGVLGASGFDSDVYLYDSSGNIRRVGGQDIQYDLMSRLTVGRVGTRDQRYFYDPFGNLTDIQTDGNPRPLNPSSSTNRLQGTGIFYDARGNLTDTPELGHIEYDDFDMPVQVGTDRWHLYTADDERVWTGKLIVGEPDHTFSVRGLDNKVLRIYEHTPPGQADDLVMLKDYIYRGAQLLASEHSVEGTRHYHLDHLGSTRQITDGARAEVARYDYFPFGEVASSEGATGEVIRFTGHERDFGGTPATDLDYMHARYYTPWLGRFLGPDPSGDSGKPPVPQTWNRYSYAHSNPLKLVDPDGRDVFLAFRSANETAAQHAFIVIVPTKSSAPVSHVRANEETGLLTLSGNQDVVPGKGLALVGLTNETADQASIVRGKARVLRVNAPDGQTMAQFEQNVVAAFDSYEPGSINYSNWDADFHGKNSNALASGVLKAAGVKDERIMKAGGVFKGSPGFRDPIKLPDPAKDGSDKEKERKREKE